MARTPYLVGLTGYAGSGKDAAAAGLVAEGWTRQAFADPVRSMALAIDPLVEWDVFSHNPVRLSLLVAKRGWHVAKQCPEVRRLLQACGHGLAGGQVHAIDRRVVERDDGNVAVGLVVGSHAGIPCKK